MNKNETIPPEDINFLFEKFDEWLGPKDVFEKKLITSSNYQKEFLTLIGVNVDLEPIIRNRGGKLYQDTEDKIKKAIIEKIKKMDALKKVFPRNFIAQNEFSKFHNFFGSTRIFRIETESYFRLWTRLGKICK